MKKQTEGEAVSNYEELADKIESLLVNRKDVLMPEALRIALAPRLAEAARQASLTLLPSLSCYSAKEQKLVFDQVENVLQSVIGGSK